MSKQHKKKGLRVLFVLAISLVILVAGCSSGTSGSSNGTGNGGSSSQEGAEGNAQAPSETSADQPMNLTMAGGSAGGFWEPIGLALGKAINEEFPDAIFTFEPGQGAANIVKVSKGEVQLGYAMVTELAMAIEGNNEFFNEPIPNIYSLGQIGDKLTNNLIMLKESADKYGITTFKDIIDKKAPVVIGLNQPGNAISPVGKSMFEFYGASPEDVKSWGGELRNAGGKDMINAMQNRTMDGMFYHSFHPNSTILEMERSVDLVYIPFEQDLIDFVNEKWKTYTNTIPAGVYKNFDEEYTANAFQDTLVVSGDMPEEEAYNIVKAWYNNWDVVSAVNPNLSEDPSSLATPVAVPLHPGAEKFYKEQGLIK